MNTHCPICGRRFSMVDLVLSEHDAGYQCRHCWNRIQATGAGALPATRGRQKKPLSSPRHTAKTPRRIS